MLNFQGRPRERAILLSLSFHHDRSAYHHSSYRLHLDAHRYLEGFNS